MATNPTIVFPKPGEVVLQELKISEPGDREVLVENIYSLISPGTELTLLSGNFPEGSIWDRLAQYPHVPGYSSVARVVRVGTNVNEDWIGRIVACRAGHCGFALQPLDSIHEVPTIVPPEEASFHTLVQIALNGIRRSGLRLGETVVIFGMGIFGHLAALFCRLGGACPVIAVDSSAYRLGLLPDDDLLVTINSSRDDLLAAVREHTRGRMADVVIEATGNSDLIAEELKLLREQGRFVILSSPRGKTEIDFHDLCCWPSISIIGAHNRSHPPVATPQSPWSKDRHLELLFILLAAHKLDLRHMITHGIHYGKVPETYQQLLAGEIEHLGIVIRWQD